MQKERRRLEREHALKEAKQAAAEQVAADLASAGKESRAMGSPKPATAKGPTVKDSTKKKIDFNKIDDSSEAGADVSPVKSMAGLAVHQAGSTAEKAIKGQLPTVGFNLRGVLPGGVAIQRW